MNAYWSFWKADFSGISDIAFYIVIAILLIAGLLLGASMFVRDRRRK